METKYILTNGKSLSVSVKDNKFTQLDDKDIDFNIAKINNTEHVIDFEGKQFEGEVVKIQQNSCTVNVNGNTYTFTIDTENSFKRSQLIQEKSKDKPFKLTASLPGKINKIAVEKNQEIKKGESLLTLEAMKMQNDILSPISGTITAINIKENDNVLKDQPLIVITPNT